MKIDNIIYYLICMYSLLSCTDVLGANHFLRAAFFLGVISLLLKRPMITIRTKHLYFIAIFLGGLFFTSFFNGVSQEYYSSLKILRSDYLLSLFPLPLIVLFIRDIARIKKIIICLMISLCATNLYAFWQFSQGINRVAGLTGNVMPLAGILILLVPMIILLMTDKQFMPRYKFIFYIAFFLSVPVIFFNATRIVWITLAIVIPIVLLFTQKNIKTVLMYICVGLVLSIAVGSALPSVQSRATVMFDKSNQSNSERLLMWKSAWSMFIDHPLAGVGVGNYKEQYYKKYISPMAKEKQIHAHNNVMHLAATTGIIGLVGFFSMFSYFLYESFKNWRRKREIAPLIFFIATLSFLIQGLTDYNIGGISVAAKIYWMILGIYLVLDKAVVVETRMKP